ncbi:unnamed protein product [Eruca vesicaria subsp. sativa]|uniref:Uncharacterized protein n=1 Tax=Eruca vesicaria subsp. sativa TaxID=29727 RepID=A0ABC8KWE9_ERUVS|nr:unnamed protein product [Eruca vesicaria subsp. sativa]
MASCGLWTPPSFSPRRRLLNFSSHRRPQFSVIRFDKERFPKRVFCSYNQENNNNNKDRTQSTGIQVYGEIERLLTETVKQSQSSSSGSADWSEVEGAWVLRPRNSNPKMVAHFIGGIFVVQLYTWYYLTPSLVQGCFGTFVSVYGNIRFEVVQDLPSFGIGHSLGSLIHLLIGSRYAVQRNGNVFMAFNNKEASLAIPLFSPVLVPMAQSLGPLLSQVATSPTVRLGAEMTRKQLETLSPPIMKQILPLVEQLPPLYMDLVKGREDFIPKPEETRRLIRSYYGISRNLLIKFQDDSIDETPILAQVLGVESSISSKLDMSIRTLPGDHGLPLQQALPDVPPAMADAVNRGSEFLANMAVGTPWESVAKEVGGTLGMDSKILNAYASKDLAQLVDAVTSWMASNMGPKLLRS